MKLAALALLLVSAHTIAAPTDADIQDLRKDGYGYQSGIMQNKSDISSLSSKTDANLKAINNYVDSVQQQANAATAAQAQINSQQQVQIQQNHNAVQAATQQNNTAIASNKTDIQQNRKDIQQTRKEMKRGLNNAVALSGLHYKSDNSWAMAAGTNEGNGAAVAFGAQKGVTEHLNVNVQASTSFDNGWAATVGMSGDF